MFVTENIKKIRNIGINLKTKSGKVISGLGKNKKKPTTKEILEDIEKNHNHSWYNELYIRNKDSLDDIALVYRGNSITYRQMFDNMKKYAKSMKQLGIRKGSEIPVCLSNTPEVVYILGAASMLGASVNLFGHKFSQEYVKEIINGTKSNVIFVEDNSYPYIKDAIRNSNVDKVVMLSLRDSLKKDMNPYELFDKNTGLFDNKVDKFKKDSDNILNQKEFLILGKDCPDFAPADVDLDDEFVITYTSGSTNEARPKQIVHSPRCYITIAKYHNKDLNGGFSLKPFTFLALIPTYSNSDILSIVSDSLMQGAKLALEPNYDKDSFVNSLVMNKPNYVAATKSFWVNASKKILSDPRYANIELKDLFFAFSCGEPLSINEENFINKAIVKAKAGQNVTHTPFTITRLSEAGGDCEHGSIFYALFRTFSKYLPTNLKNKTSGGMGTFPFVEVAILDENGNLLDKNQMGRIVANSPCTMKYYKNNEKATEEFYTYDVNGKKWADLKVYGYLDDNNKIHIKGRIPKEGELLPTYVLKDRILLDVKNILSCEVIKDEKTGVFVAHIELQPSSKENIENVIYAARRRCSDLLKVSGDRMCFRIRSHKEAFPLTGSGKLSAITLKEEGISEKCVYPVVRDNKIQLKSVKPSKDKQKKKIK